MTESWMPIAGRPVQQELDRLWLNQQAAAHNLANIQTPGFVGTRVVKNDNPSFDLMLSKELSRTDSRHLALSSSSALPENFTEQAVPDLSPDSEMAEVSKTVVSYQTLIEVVARKDRMARLAIEGR
jgi:flagellar basal body rod protein FlgB